MTDLLQQLMTAEYLQVLLLVGGVAMLIMAWRMHEKDVFDFRDLVRENSGRISLAKFSQFGAFCISTWVFVLLAVRNNLTEWYYSTYMLSWAGAGLATAWINKSRAEKYDAVNLANMQQQNQQQGQYGMYGTGSSYGNQYGTQQTQGYQLKDPPVVPNDGVSDDGVRRTDG